MMSIAAAMSIESRSAHAEPGNHVGKHNAKVGVTPSFPQ
jgi:hypothetical protein